MYIFAYGSLIFRPGFPYLERRRAFVRGFQRRFWQGSPDHRGVPHLPGRVATLIPTDNASPCGGCAYRVVGEQANQILAALDDREQAGFERREVRLFDDHAPDSDSFATGITWIAGSDNNHFLGPLSEEEIARWVMTRRGPSGENRDYVLALAGALRELHIRDPHVEGIMTHLDRLLGGEPASRATEPRGAR